MTFLFDFVFLFNILFFTFLFIILFFDEKVILVYSFVCFFSYWIIAYLPRKLNLKVRNGSYS